MKMHNFTIRGNCLEIVGRVVNPDAERPVTVYDLDFPCGMENMSLEELENVIMRIKEDIDDLFYYDGEIRDNTMCKFEKAWNEDDEGDADGA